VPEESRYVASLTKELNSYAKEDSWQGLAPRSIFFGGGTPSLFSPESILSLVSSVKACFPRAESEEITLEANPGTIQESLDEKLCGFLRAGITRLSLGVQSFNNKKLQALGRIHSAEDSVRSIIAAREAGFTSLSLDLIMAAPSESQSAWRDDLRRALDFSPEHISVYLLSIEPKIPFHSEMQSGALQLPAEGDAAEMYLIAQEMLLENGYEQYEISNFSKPGFFSRHNSAYWARSSYLGLGAGAHSFLASVKPFGLRWQNEASLEAYLTRVEEKGQARLNEEVLSEAQAELEMLLSLRRKEGILFSDYQKLFGRPFLPRYAERLAPLAERGLVVCTTQQLCLSKKGRLFLDSVLEELL
jgi:oxygen-independent coproporphyrinogen-3 oxidase